MPDRNGWQAVVLLSCLIVLGLGLGTAAIGQQLSGAPPEHADDGIAIAEEIEVEPILEKRRQESFLEWMARSLGLFGFLHIVVGVLCFGCVLLLVYRGDGPFAATALLLIVPIPLLIGFYGFLQGSLMTLLGRVDIHPRVINDARLRNPR